MPKIVNPLDFVGHVLDEAAKDTGLLTGMPVICGTTDTVMKGVAMSLLDCKTYLEQKGVKIGNKAYVIGGGAKSKVWRQIVADALNLTLIQTENNDSSFGSAMCAGIYAGFFKDFDEASNTCRKVIGETKPIAQNTERYAKVFAMYQKISKFLMELADEK